jgi:hypothetical protein
MGLTFWRRVPVWWASWIRASSELKERIMMGAKIPGKEATSFDRLGKKIGHKELFTKKLIKTYS